MATEFEDAVYKKLKELIENTKDIHDIHEIVKGLDELNRNIEKQTAANLELNRNIERQNQNIEKLIKILVEKEKPKKK